MKKKINYYLVATALFVAIATMVSMTVINYYLFQKQVKEDLQVMAETIESTGILKQDINEIPQIDVEGIRVTWIDKDGTVLYDNQNDVKKLENHGDIPLRHRPGVVPSARAVLVFCYVLLTQHL